MKLTINGKNKQYLWEQVYEQIIFKIMNGELKAGDKLPSIREFSEISGIGECTLIKAFTRLKSDGYIYSNTTGYYVSEDISVNHIREIYLKDMEATINGVLQTGKQLGLNESEMIALFERKGAGPV